uniref:Uncharacterized protein n=1 Tax=Ackermannviridae sp. TaxID=2831612 RepID=A0A8S5RRH8_9CAUD|nr:MAG TPA: hypothetical protein [Ackermannviridae sp.]
MAKVSNREDALLQAYLSRYKAAQDSAVTGGQQSTQKAQRRGSAILNATDKTLPSLGNPYESTLKNIVGGVSTENSLNLDFMNRQVSLAKKKFDMANDYAQQVKKAQEYAEKQAKAAAKAAARAAGGGSSGGGAGGDTESSASLDALFGGGTSTGTNTNANSAKPNSTKPNSTTNRQKKPSAQEQYLADKASGKRKAITSNSYAERSNAAQPAQSRAVTKGGKVIGSSYAAAGSAPSASERTAAKKRQERVADSLQKLQTDASYRAELAKPGRKLDSAEVEAVNQYVKSTKNTGFSGLKRVFDLAKNSDNLSKDEYAKKSAELNAELNQNSALRAKAQGNGAGQSAQAFTAGLYDSVPFLSKASDAMASAANATGLGPELPMLTKTLDDTKTYDPVAATLGTMAGKAMQYKLFNTLAAGTKYGKAAQAVGGKIGAAAQKIPGLGALVGDGFGDAAGRVLADTGADFVLDTLPSLASDVSEGKSAGEVAGNIAKNIVGNVAMNALPEIGGAVFNRIKGAAGDAAQDALKQADSAAQEVPQTAPARNIVQPDANGTTGLTAQIQRMNTPDAANRSALNTLDELRGQVNLNGAQEKEAEQLRRAVLQRQQEIGDEAKLALQNSGNMPIDAATDTGYNNINNIGGVTNEAVQGRSQYDGARSDGILQGSSDGTPQSGQRLAVGAESGEYLPANRVLVAEHLSQRPSVYNDSTRAIAEQASAGAFDFRNSDDAPKTFAQALATAKANNANGAAVDGHTAEEIANIVNNGGKTFLTPDGTAGGAVEANGNLTCVFKDAANNSTPGAGSSIALAAVNNGATKGDCYGRALVNMYSKAGLEPVARIPYAYGYNDAMDAQVRKQIADGIISKEPDVYALKLRDGYNFEKAAAEFNTAHRYTQSELDALPVYDDYDEMLAYRDSLLKTPSAMAEGVSVMPDTAKNATQNLPLNGSESVPEHAVGAASTQYDRREVLNQDYANQRAMGGKIDADEAAAAGIGQQTHTVYSRAEGKDTAKQDFDLLVQQNGDILSAGRTVADELARKSADGNFDASDVYRGYYAADQLQNMLNSYEKGSADAQLVQAQIENLNRAVSAGQSKNAQALSAGRWAQIDEYTPIRKFEQITQRKVNDFAKTRDGKQLESLASDVVEMAKSGPQDEEFTAFLKAQGVDVGDNPLNAQMDDLAKRIKRMADAKGIKATDEQAKSAAASILAGGNADDVFNAMARKSLGIENLSQEDYDYVKNAFAEMADMPDSKARYEKEMDAYKRLTKYMPAKTFGDKMESIRYLSMLGNTRTHARNVLGNVSMGVVTRAKDNVSGVMQLALPKDQRTKAVGTTLTADGRKMVDLAKEYGQNKMYSVLYNDGKFNAESGLRAAQDTFTSKPGKIIQKAADINSALLEKEDDIFLTSAFGNAMASQLKARGYDSSVFTATDAKSKQALVDAAATALRDAKEATSHEDNFLSTALKNYQNDIKGHGVGGKILWAVGEGVLPFKKTPLNIAKNAMEYNIVGGTVEAAYRYATGASNADVIDAAAKGLTGTALMGIGGILAYNGLLNGSDSGDDRADAFDEMTGKQEYSINIPGKGTYTIDWASPASVPLLMGAEIANEWQNGGLSVTKFLDAARKIGNPILETTMLQGLNDTLDSVSYADSDDKLATLLIGTLGSYAQQYVPTALGQIARTIDPLRRSTYGGGDGKTERDANYAIRKAENKIPGLSMNNEPYIDQWGREQASLDGTDDSAGGMFLRGAYNMLSPGYIRQENITPVDEYLQELYGSTNDSHVYPEKASSKITVDSKNYYLTPEEKTEYAKTSGQTAYDLIDELRQNSMFLQLPEDQQSALVQDAYTVAKTAGGVAAVGDGVSGVNAKEYEAYRDGGTEGFSQYVLMKNATDLVRDEKRESSGNENAALNTVEKWNTLYSQFGDDAVSNFVNSTDMGSTVRNISDLAGDKAVTAYMQSYSAVANTLDDGQTPDKFTVGYGMQKYGLSGDDFARAYLAAYYKKDKNGKYPEKGSGYADKAGAEIYQSYGADALQGWVNYRATIPDENGNGKVDKDEAMARLNEMDLTNELRRAYLAKTNKQWKNPY